MSPLERYKADLQRPDFFHDPAQERAVRHLQRLYDELIASDQTRPGLLDRLRKRKPEPVKGLYFWGGVGRGKTYLVDTFYDGRRRLILSAEVPAKSLYTAPSGTERFEFDRTVSRLFEMRSEDYFSHDKGEG